MGWVELGRLGAPFGVKGWTHVVSYTDPPEGLLKYAPWVLRLPSGERVSRRVAEAQPRGERLVARLESIEDRDAAAALTGAAIEVSRNALPPAGARQYYRADLVGLAVHNLEGASLGTVSHFVEAPTAPVMVVKDVGGREHWVLAAPRHLHKVDLDEGLIVVDWPVELE